MLEGKLLFYVFLCTFSLKPIVDVFCNFVVLYCLFSFRLSILIIIKRILYYFHVNLSRQPGIRQGCPLLDLFFSLEFDAKWNSYCFLFHEFYGQISCWKICLAPFLFLIRIKCSLFPESLFYNVFTWKCFWAILKHQIEHIFFYVVYIP